MSYIDQGSDIEVPIVEITNGWTVDDVETIDDCDDAFAYLTGAIVSIESQIDLEKERGTINGQRLRRLNGALRWKKAALQIVQNKRSRINRLEQATLERRFMDLVAENYQTVFKECKAVALDSIARADRLNAEKAND